MDHTKKLPLFASHGTVQGHILGMAAGVVLMVLLVTLLIGFFYVNKWWVGSTPRQQPTASNKEVDLHWGAVPAHDLTPAAAAAAAVAAAAGPHLCRWYLAISVVVALLFAAFLVYDIQARQLACIHGRLIGAHSCHCLSSQMNFWRLDCGHCGACTPCAMCVCQHWSASLLFSECAAALPLSRRW
jgi:hypothetical protein